jgi:hypothetical protein
MMRCDGTAPSGVVAIGFFASTSKVRSARASSSAIYASVRPLCVASATVELVRVVPIGFGPLVDAARVHGTEG